MQMENASPRRRKALQFGTVVGVAAAAVLTSASPSWAAADTATLNPASGPAAGTNTITMTVASQSDPANSFIPGSTFVTYESVGTCPATHTAGMGTTIVGASTPATTTVLSPTKLAFTAPGAAITISAGISMNTNTYSLCAYNATAGPLVAKAETAYSVGATPVVNSISPKAASAKGGGSLVITGTGLASTTATLGGVPLSLTISGGGTIATAPIPPHAAGGPYPLVVTKTGGGSVSLPNAFTYSNGVIVTPNNGSNTRTRTDVSVQGANLSGITFTTTNGSKPDDTNGHVYLTKGAYDPAKPTPASLVKSNPQITECLNVVVISDTELICSLYLAGGGITMSSTRNVSATVSGSTLTAPLGNFGPADVGMLVTGSASIPTGTSIAAVLDPTRVQLTKAATAAITTAATLALTPSRSFSDATLTAGSTAIASGGTASFAAADVGRPITGANIPAGTTISAVASGTAATLSQPATNTASGSYVIGAAPLNEVPVGTYTMTVVNNGSVDAQTSGTFSKSVISSGSTFTVADY